MKEMFWLSLNVNWLLVELNFDRNQLNLLDRNETYFQNLNVIFVADVKSFSIE